MWVQNRLQAYIMAYLKLHQNYNGTGVVSRIVMTYFKNTKVIMARFQLTLR
jgi:hypothetical protein